MVTLPKRERERERNVEFRFFTGCLGQYLIFIGNAFEWIAAMCENHLSIKRRRFRRRFVFFFFLEALNFISSLPSFINLQDRNIFGAILFLTGESEWNFEIYRDLVFYYEINKRGKKLYFLNVFVFEKFKNLNLKRIRENFVFDED